MDWKTWGPLAAALAMGSIAAYVGYELMTRPTTVVEQPAVELATIVVAARPVAAGTELGPADLAVIRIEPKDVPAGAFAAPGAVAGRVSITTLWPGQLVTREQLAAPGVAAGIGALLPQGQRAMTIEINEYAGLRGFLRPEARVDIVAAIRGEGPPVARTVVQNIRVLAVSGRIDGEPESDEPAGNNRQQQAIQRAVTLMVTPEQAAAIELAINTGRPRLVLRAGGDEALSDFEGMTLAELRGDRRMGRSDDSYGDWHDPFADLQQPETQPLVPVAESETAEADTPPAPVEPPVARERPRPAPEHVIEVIRAGTVTRHTFAPASPRQATQPGGKPQKSPSEKEPGQTRETAVAGTSTD